MEAQRRQCLLDGRRQSPNHTLVDAPTLAPPTPPPPCSSSSLSRPRTPPLNTTPHVARPVLRHAHSSPTSPSTTTRISPTPSQYEPAYPPIGTLTASQYHSRTSSPTLGSVSMPMVEDEATMMVGGATLSARSRNGSVTSLTSLGARQSVMRSASGGLQVPLNGYHHG